MKKSMKFDFVPNKGGNFAAAMGISPKREKILDEASKEAFENKKGKVSEILAELSAIPETPAELSYMMFQLGYNHGKG